MREIKFRAWDTVTRKMYLDVGLFLNSSNAFEENNYEGLFINPSRNSVFKLMQFTGLHDKNGKEIWEGDIIHMPAYETQEVLFKQGMFCIEEDGSWFPISQFYSTTEVIGNIYENPELLEVL